MGDDLRVTVETDEGELRFDAPTIEVARLVATAHGFDCDLEPVGPGHVKLTAKRGKTTLNFKGTTENDVAHKMLKGLIHG